MTNNVAGVHYMTRIYPSNRSSRFDSEPSRGVVHFLENNGFRWKREPQHWARAIGYKSASLDRELGRRGFGAVFEMLPAEKSVWGHVPRRSVGQVLPHRLWHRQGGGPLVATAMTRAGTEGILPTRPRTTRTSARSSAALVK